MSIGRITLSISTPSVLLYTKRRCRFWSLGSKASSRYTSPEKSFGIVCEFSPFRLDKGVKMG